MAIKHAVIACLQVWKRIHTGAHRVIVYLLFERVVKVTDKSLAVVQLNHQRLIVDGRPEASDRRRVAVFANFIAFICLCDVILQQADAIGGDFWAESKLVIVRDDLKLIR